MLPPDRLDAAANERSSPVSPAGARRKGPASLRAIESLFRLARHLPTLDPLGAGLAVERTRLASSLAAQVRPALIELAPSVLNGEAAAVAAHDALVADALDQLRGARFSGRPGLLADLDRLLYRNSEEWLDDPAFPEKKRVHLLDILDRFNLHLGSYAAWWEILAGLYPLDLREPSAADRPLRVHDLAAGHGGFAIWLKDRLGDRIELTASDVRQEYLDLGRQHARARGLNVRFVHQDATDLRGLAGEAARPDVFLCTQSLHHFPPGMVSRLIGQAAQSARLGACFIDGERGFVPIALLCPLLLAYGRSYTVVHDTWVSLRRMYSAEELLLLARLAPGAELDVQVGRRRPGYAYLAVSRPARD